MDVKNRLACLFAALLFAAIPAHGAPNLWWDHLDGGSLGQTECVNKAAAIFDAEKAGRITRAEDSVRSWTEQTTGVVECIKTDGKLMIMVLVGSDDATGGNRLFTALKKGMTP
jgi:hypothetical protein